MAKAQFNEALIECEMEERKSNNLMTFKNQTTMTWKDSKSVAGTNSSIDQTERDSKNLEVSKRSMALSEHSFLTTAQKLIRVAANEDEEKT